MVTPLDRGERERGVTGADEFAPVHPPEKRDQVPHTHWAVGRADRMARTLGLRRGKAPERWAAEAVGRSALAAGMSAAHPPMRLIVQLRQFALPAGTQTLARAALSELVSSTMCIS
jgi:hypothetical protein